MEFLIYFAIGIVYLSASAALHPKKFKKLQDENSSGSFIVAMGITALLWPLIVLINLSRWVVGLTPAGKRAKLKSKQDEMSDHRKQIDSLLDEAFALEAGSAEHQEKLAEVDRLSDEADDLATEINRLRR